MSSVIPESHKDLLEKPVVVTVVTVADGSPYSTVVWQKWDGQYLYVSAENRSRKARNIRQNPQVSVVSLDPTNPYRYLELGGTVEIVPEGAAELLDELAQHYMGKPTYFGDVEPAENRAKYDGVVLKITPTRAVKFG